MKNETIIDENDHRWVVHHARSKQDAINAINHCRATGTIGTRWEEWENGKPVVVADIAYVGRDQ